MAGFGAVETGHKVASHSVWVFYHSIPHHGGGSRAEHGVVEGFMGGAQANPFCILKGEVGGEQFKAIK